MQTFWWTFGLCLVLLVGIVLFWSWAKFQRQIHNLRRVARQLERGVVEGQARWLASLLATRLTGELDGFPVTVSFDRKLLGRNDSVGVMRYTVTVREPVSAFEIRRAGPLRKVGERLGLVRDAQVGVDRIDTKYVLDGEEGTLKELLADLGTEEALDDLLATFEYGVKLEGSELRGSIPLLSATTAPQQVLAVLREMTTLAQRCQRSNVVFEALGNQPRFAWTPRGNAPRCPYCREDLPADASNLVVCTGCETVHHQDCLTEAGGCTLLGCRSAPRQRA